MSSKLVQVNDGTTAVWVNPEQVQFVIQARDPAANRILAGQTHVFFSGGMLQVAMPPHKVAEILNKEVTEL